MSGFSMCAAILTVLWCVAAGAGAGAGEDAGAASYRVLVVFPLPGRSHGALGHSLVDILLEAGHEVTYVTAFPKNSSNPRLQYIDISFRDDEIKGADRLDLSLLAREGGGAHRVLELGAGLAARALRHPALAGLLPDTRHHFHLVVAEWFYSGLLAPLSAVWGCPLVWYSAGDASGAALSLVHEAPPAAYAAELTARAAPQHPYSAWQRATNLCMQAYLAAWTYYMTQHVEVPVYEEVFTGPLRARGRTLPAYEEVTHNASLLLLNAYPPVAQPLPLPPAAHYVGGHHLRLPLEPLPLELQKILDEAENGAIFFSMGSNLKSADFPAAMLRELVAVLGQLEQTVIWKLEEPLDELPENLHVLPWVPQTSILNHENTVMLISEGGQLSLMEATQFGVPVVGVPVFGDEFVNMDVAAARGAAIRVDFASDLPLRIKDAIHDMLSDYRYRSSAQLGAKVFRSRAESPRATVARLVLLAVETRGAPHLRSPAARLPLVHRLYLDVTLAAVLALALLYKLVAAVTAACRPPPPLPHHSHKKHR